MTDSDLRRWLARQSTTQVGHVSWARAGAEVARSSLAEAAGRGETLVVVEAVTDEDLVAIGKACAEARLITGCSSIALALPSNLGRAGLASDGASTFRPMPGPEAVLAGSCSWATLTQVAWNK